MAATKKADPKDNPLFRALLGYHEEAKQAKLHRMYTNRDNFDAYHLRQDFSHKKKGQSKEFLAKQQTSVEQITSFLQQGLIDVGEWFRIELEDGVVNPLILQKEIQKLLFRQLKKNNFPALAADTMKSGLLGALMIVKIGGKMMPKVSFKTRLNPKDGKKRLIKKERPVWQLDLSLVRQEDWFPDPTGDGLYEQEVLELDKHELIKLARRYPDEFDMSVVEKLQPNPEEMQKVNRRRETDQNTPLSNPRKRIRIIEHWGTICDPESGEVLHENCMARFLPSGEIITQPMQNPNWHGKSPYVSSPIVRVPNSVWHRALMDAPTRHNLAINEVYNLMLDSGLSSVFGIRQCREDFLDDPAQISDGIAPGTTLMVNSSCPPGQKALERVDTGTEFTQAGNMFQITDREFQSSSFTNDTRLGNLPQRAVKATEIVASNQSITGVFNGIVKIIEDNFMSHILEKSWMTMAQNMNDLDLDEVKAIIGEDRALKLSSISPEDRFANTALGQRYKVFGLSTTLNKIQDFRKISTFLQTVGASPVFVQEFQRVYSVTKLMGEIVKSLDIDETKIKADPQELAERQREQAIIQRHEQQKAQTQGGDMNQVADSGSTPDTTGQAPRSDLNTGMTSPG